MTKTRILLVDDHVLFSRGLASLLNGHTDLEVCGTASNSSEALRQLKILGPDLAIVDLSLKSESGVELLKQMRAEASDLILVVLTFHSEPLYMVRTLAHGAAAYIQKTEQPSAIVAAVRTALGGKLHLGEQFVRLPISKAIHNFRDEGKTPDSRLTGREAEVFALMGDGMEVGAVCETLKISIKTFETHRSHMKDKFNCATATELLQFATQWKAFKNESAESSSKEATTMLRPNPVLPEPVVENILAADQE